MGQNHPPKKVGVNGHFQASWATQPMGCLVDCWLYRHFLTMIRELTMIATVLQVLRMLHSMALTTRCHLVMEHPSASVDSRSTFHARQRETTRTELHWGGHLLDRRSLACLIVKKNQICIIFSCRITRSKWWTFRTFSILNNWNGLAFLRNVCRGKIPSCSAHCAGCNCKSF